MQTSVTRIVYPRDQWEQFDRWMATLTVGYTAALWPGIEQQVVCSDAADRLVLYAVKER